ncbi:hypothetical protein [Nocardia veterana]|uniref:Uncharacterized protein n=1 Tax=Nocardia veterana TaxID=132249 RepID=A0A7X6RJQ0_9NOCA|nr:hypothetical protein [Nocardia veterana]NKY87908.1 hypothetical protein [Nocardia veterana]
MIELGADPVGRIRQIFAAAVADGLRGDSVSGASDAEIDAWATGQGARAVPAAVREVLRLLGRDHGLWLAGSSLGVVAVQRQAKNHLVATLPSLGDPLVDPEGALVLVDHQSYTFHVVDGADLDLPDPPVWLVTEREGSEKRWGTVSFWFRALTPDVARLRERLEIMQELDSGRVPGWARFIEPR